MPAPVAEPTRSPGTPHATVAEARALAHPLRLRIIRLLYDRSLTNRELARALGEHPATVLHHVRTLLRTGFIAADPERRGPRGTVEKPYRSTGRSWSLAIDDDDASPTCRAPRSKPFSPRSATRNPHADLHTSRLAVNLSAEGRDELDERLAPRCSSEYATPAARSRRRAVVGVRRHPSPRPAHAAKSRTRAR